MAGFFDYSMQDNAIRIVTEGATKTIPITAMLDQEIRRWLVSEQRKWQVAGNNYYEGRHDILKKKRMAIGQGGQLEEITNLPNSKNIDNQYRKMVKQKTNYLCGKPFSIRADNDVYTEVLGQFFNRSFFRQFKNIAKDSLNCAIGWLYVGYDEQGQFRFKRFKPWELIPGWKDADHTELDYMIRRYMVDVYDGREYKKQERIEYYTLQGIDYFMRYNGSIVACAPWHEDYFTMDGNNYNWQKLPFIPFRYNDEEIPLIANCKSLQDGLNKIISNFEDNMEEDPRNTIMVLVNYAGENLGEFRRNLATYGAVKVTSRDGVSGDVKTLSVEVNAENYKSILDIFRKAIVENCMGFDAKDERMNGTPNQMNIQSMYSDIDLDASDMETEFQAALEQLIWFINMHLVNTGVGDFTGESYEIVFNTDMPMDEASTIQNIRNSVGILSTETLIANHPWTSGNPQKEIEQLKKEKQEEIDQYSGAFGGENQPTREENPPTDNE